MSAPRSGINHQDLSTIGTTLRRLRHLNNLHQHYMTICLIHHTLRPSHIRMTEHSFHCSPRSPLLQSQPVPAHNTEALPQQFYTLDQLATPLPQWLHVASDLLMAALPSPPFMSPSTQDDPFWVPPTVPILRRDVTPYQLTSLPRPHVGGNRERWTVGIQDLPSTIHVTFHGKYIRQVIRTVFSNTSPWINPLIKTLQ